MHECQAIIISLMNAVRQKRYAWPDGSYDLR